MKFGGLGHGCLRPHRVLSSCFGILRTCDLRYLETFLFLSVQKDVSINKSDIWVTVSLLLKSQTPSTFEEECVFMAQTPLPLVFNLLQIE